MRPNPTPRKTPTQPNSAPHAGAGAGSGKLTAALHRYHADSDKTRLQAAYADYKADTPGISSVRKLSNLVYRAFSTLTLFPPPRTPQTETEAIAKYWQKVGDYLSYGITTQILTDEQDGTQK